jgi:hypothetical protein
MTDDLRRAFLARLEQPLRERASDAAFEYGKVPGFLGIALTVRVPGRAGFIRVTAVSLRDQVKSWGDPFPGAGIPHWDLYAHGEDGKPADHLCSCQLPRVAEAFAAWLALTAGAPAALRGRPPGLDHLRRIAEAPLPAAPASMRGEALAAAASLAADERDRFEADVGGLAGKRIAWFFPRDDDGAPEADARVLLAAYGAETAGRRLWLHVVPVGRPRARTLTLALAPLIGHNHGHRWDAVPWMWDARVAPPPAASRWGIGGGADAERVQQSLALLDEGRFGEALAPFGIDWTTQVARVAAGQPISLQEAPLADRWAAELGRILWGLAPWKLAVALDGLAVKSHRLSTFGGQRQIRKASLMLERAPGDANRVRLSIEYTGTNARLPLIAFCRSVDQDLARFGLAPADLPDEATAPAPLAMEAPAAVDVEKVSRTLATKLRHLEGAGYDAAIAAARKLDPAVAAGVLAEAMRDPAPGVRRRACEVAGVLEIDRCHEAAMVCLQDDDGLVAGAAAGLLRRIRHAPALSAIAQRMLASRAFFVTGAAAFRAWGARPGADALRVHLTSHDEGVRAAACLTVVQYGGKVLAPTLRDLAADPSPLVAAAALRALEALAAGELLAEARAAVARRPDVAAVHEAHANWTSYRRV